MKGFKPTGYGPSAGFKFPASFGFTGSTGAYTNVQPYVRRMPRAFKDGGYVSETVPDPGSALVRRARPYTEEDRESGGKTPLRPGYKHGGMKKPCMKSGGKWIAGAIKHPGALHKALGVPEGQKIPAKKLAKAAHSDNPTTRRRAVLAKTLGKMHKADGGALMSASPLATLNRMRRKPPRPPVASTVKERFAADGGPAIPRRSKDYTVMESLRAIPGMIRTGIGMMKDKMSSGERTVEGRSQSVDEAASEAVSGKTMASNYSRGGKMRRMGYAKGGGVSRMEAKKIAQSTIGEHVRYPAPKGHKGMGAMIHNAKRS